MKSKHILVISQYFYPETFRINDMAKEWVKRGYQVTVLTGIPNYPMGKTFKGYGLFKKRREKFKGMDIIRIPLIPRGNSRNKFLNALGMTANYLSFVLSGYIWSHITGLKADMVFSYEVSPMTQVLIGTWFCKRRKIPHYVYVQDLWPENVEMVTGIHSPLVIRPIDRMVDYIYKHASMIFVSSESFRKAITSRRISVSEEKVIYLPQYAEEFYHPIERNEAVKALKNNMNLPGRFFDKDIFKIAFAGNVGTAQGLDILPKTAELLKANGITNCLFVIIGDGRSLPELIREIKERNVEDMFLMIERQPAERIPALLSCCDSAFLSYEESKLWEMTVPAKLQSYMACGMPVIAAVRGESERIIKEAKCGYCVGIGDKKGLNEVISGLDKERLKEMGVNARKYAGEHFDKKKLMDELDTFFAHFL